MGSVRAGGLDRAALFEAVEQRRGADGVSWRAVEEACGVSATTIKRMATAGIIEADGVVAVVAWLGRSVSEFVDGPSAEPLPLPTAPPGHTVRVDLAGVYERLDALKAERGSTWEEVAAEVTAATGIAISAATLTRFGKGGRTDIDRLLAVTRWLCQPVERFMMCTEA